MLPFSKGTEVYSREAERYSTYAMRFSHLPEVKMDYWLVFFVFGFLVYLIHYDCMNAHHILSSDCIYFPIFYFQPVVLAAEKYKLPKALS